MPFASMVVFMVKWAIASIHALLILVIAGNVPWALLVGFFVSLAALFGPHTAVGVTDILLE